MRKIRFSVLPDANKNNLEDRIYNLEKYIVVLQRELEYAINQAIARGEE